MVHLMRVEEEYCLELREIRFDSIMLKQIIQNGVPSGFQNSVIATANVFVQSNINAFGKMAMAGCGSYSKIEGFAFLPVTCFTMALTTFVSQNLGAKQYDRAKKGARFGVDAVKNNCIILLSAGVFSLYCSSTPWFRPRICSDDRYAL